MRHVAYALELSNEEPSRTVASAAVSQVYGQSRSYKIQTCDSTGYQIPHVVIPVSLAVFAATNITN